MAVIAEETDLPRRTLMWIAGAFLSMFLFAAVIALSYTLGAREGGFGEPPFIRAAEGPYKIVPEQPGGQAFPHQKIGVYDRISGTETAMVEQLLPPSEQPLDPNLIPRTAPRVIDDVPASDEPVVILPLPDPNSESSKVATQSAGSTMEIETVPPIEQPNEQPMENIQNLESGRDLPPAETVTEGTIAGLIRQSTAPIPPSASSTRVGETEMVMTRKTPDVMPVVPQASRLEPVVAEEIMSDPARVVDGKRVDAVPVETATPMKTATPIETATAEIQQPLVKPEVADVMPETLPEKTPAPSTMATAAPEPAKSNTDGGQQIAALDLDDLNASKEKPKAMPAGSYLVQIGAFRKKEEAEQAWRRASKTHKDLIAQLRPSIQRADLGKRGIYFRLRAGPLENKAQARSLCKLLEKRKLACLVPKQ